MARYMLLFMGAQMDSSASQSEMQGGMKRWNEWIQGLTNKGMFESGLPFQNGGKLVKKRSSRDYKVKRTDITGYMIIKAGSIDEAVEVSKKSPHAAMGGKTIVRPCVEMDRQDRH